MIWSAKAATFEPCLFPIGSKGPLIFGVAGAGISAGRLFRCVCRAGKHWGDGVTERVVWHVVKQYARKLGFAQVAPHDLRHSCAKLCHSSGGEFASDPIPSRARFRADNRTQSRLQAADSRSRERPHRHRTIAFSERIADYGSTWFVNTTPLLATNGAETCWPAPRRCRTGICLQSRASLNWL